MEKTFVKTSGRWKFRAMVEKIMIGLVLAVMVGSIDAPQVYGKEDHKKMERHDNGRYEHRGRGYERDRYGHGGHGYRPYGYAGGAYGQPPVIYAPSPVPGIGIFFPPIYLN